MHGTNKQHDFHPTFNHIAGQTNRNNLTEIHNNLCKNALFFHFNLGGVNHGLLAIVIVAQDYLAQTGRSFILLTNPINYPNISAHIIEQKSNMIERTHKQEILIFKEFLCVGKAPKHHFTNTTKPIYMAFLKKRVEQVQQC